MMTSFAISVCAPPLRALPPFTPASLFAAGERGIWLDPSDLSTMWSDTAGTLAASVGGLPVARCTDRSGSSNHLLQATASDRPQLLADQDGRRYLAFNGVNHGLRVASIVAGLGQMQCFVAIRKESDATVAVLAEFGVGMPVGAFYLTAPHTVGPTFGAAIRGTTQRTVSATAPNFAAPTTAVLSMQGNTLGPLVMRVNGVEAARTALSAGGGTLGNLPFDLGRRGNGTVPFRGRVYGLVLRFGPQLTPHQIWLTERWLGQKVGIVL